MRPLDPSLLAEALSRPGIDPRVWCFRGIVIEVEIDQQNDVYADVQLLHTDEVITCHVGLLYGGNVGSDGTTGFGLYIPVNDGDEVVAIMPSGDINDSPTIIARLWSNGVPPMQEAGQYPNDVILRVQDGNNLRVITTGAGNVMLNPRGTGKVMLACDSETIASEIKKVVHEGMVEAFNTHVHASNGAVPTVQLITTDGSVVAPRVVVGDE